MPEAVRQRLRELIAADPAAPPLEFLRQLREEGASVGESTFSRIFRVEKEAMPAEPMVRPEGVAGEFGQFDFGVADVRLLDKRTERIHFAAYRLKYSRWGWVAVVPDERIESLVRALLACFEHAGGVPLRVVFDNPKPLAALGQVLHDANLAEAILDRLLERGTHYVLRGRSYGHRVSSIPSIVYYSIAVLVL